jgi:hypothetical protein
VANRASVTVRKHHGTAWNVQTPPQQQQQQQQQQNAA